MDRRAVAASAAALAALVVLVPAPASSASCAEGSGPAGSDVVFLGTVDGARGGFTRFAVDEVWTGPDLAPEVWVLSGQRGWGVSSSTDADLADGDRYVVGTSAEFRTSACSITDVVRGHAVSGRPTSVREPTTAGSEGADPPASAVEWLARVAAGIAGLFLLVYAGGALRRRRLA